jgi:cupin fold WbuC family metalloprotein
MLLDQPLFTTLLVDAAQNPRRRSARVLHQSYAEPVQRMLVAMQPDSYVQPHQHTDPNQWELFVILQGQADFLVFSATGQLLQKHRLAVGQSCCGLELSPGQFHSVIAVDGPVVFLEVKQGPFDPTAPRSYGSFAPAETEPHAGAFLQQMRLAKVGDVLAGVTV